MTVTDTRRRRAAATTSWMALSLVLAFGASAAQAQSTGGAPQPSGSVVEDEGQLSQEILVVGSRASQQSANNRKKNAATATDSLVADDIGSFPDRNVNEAISRIPGVALTRNIFGEGEGIAVRGNGPDLTRVELDGVGVQGTNALAIDGTGSRGADLRELPAELIKSVDVVKGSTADMTEGSLGGGIQIKTRSGLDFKKPYFSFRAGAQQNSLGRDWTPDFNAVTARRFFNDRLGVIVSGTYSKIQNNGHGYETTTSNNRNYNRLYDFDNSPEKTFTFNPSTVGTDAADVPFANSTAPDGTTLTPRELVTLAAGAQTKAQCLSIFPNIAAPTANQSTAQNAVRTQRILEQQTCLNQWNDYTPSLIRNFMNTQTDERYSFDARFDYRVTDNLTVFIKGTRADRKVHDQNRSRNQLAGNNGIFNSNLAGTFVDTTTGYPLIRSVSPNAPAGYAAFDQQFGLTSVTSIVNGVNSVRPVYGNVLNVVPGSVTVDSAHNVTQMTLTNNVVNIDQIENKIDTETAYAQAGAEWRSDNLDIDLFGGMTRAQTSRGDMRTNRSYTYGDATIVRQDNGLWDIQVPSNYDETNPASYVQVTTPACVSGGTNPATCVGQAAVAAGPNGPATPAYLVSQLPQVTPLFGVTYSPRLGISKEKIAKLDLTYRIDDMPFFTRVKIGAQYRNGQISRWGGGGYTAQSAVGAFGTAGYVPAVIVPTAQVRGSFRACQPTAGSSAAGGLSCNYGFVPSTNPLNVRSGVDTLTPQQLRDLFAATLEQSDSKYFGDLPNRGSLPDAWQGIRTDELFAQLGGSQFLNADCLIRCVGSDGKVYEQPVTRTNETIKNLYALVDFEQQLPYGLLFNGNGGVRGIFANVSGSGLQTINSTRVTPAFNPADPNNATGIIVQSFAYVGTLNSKTRDWLPSVNLNLWAFDKSVVLRAYGGKTVARPPIDRLIPGGTCNIDERQLLDDAEDTFGCSGRLGNPALKPFTAWNYNFSVEWYPNADTTFAATYGILDVKIGNPIAVTSVLRPFANSDLIDPGTGRPLSEVQFSVPTWANGPGYKRNIYEFSVKTAFTSLPWIFRHTGVDANLSILKSVVTTGQQDPNSGTILAPPDESKYYLNTSLWYDDGTFNLRVAYQKRTSRFLCVTPCGGNTTDINYPGEQWTNVRLVGPGYNPGVARYFDGSEFWDAKASWNVNRNFQVYLEGRNVTRQAQTISTGDFIKFADGTPRVLQLLYGGRRILAGARLQFR
ncbi:TonB-dependent receptor [Sphingomonas sp. RS2018]